MSDMIPPPEGVGCHAEALALMLADRYRKACTSAMGAYALALVLDVGWAWETWSDGKGGGQWITLFGCAVVGVIVADLLWRMKQRRDGIKIALGDVR